MAKIFNRARMTTATSGVGTITLGSAVSGYQTFAAAGVADGDLVPYVIEDGTSWEIGIGTYTASGTTLARTTVLESTNADAAISLSGSAEVFIAIASDGAGFVGGNLRLNAPVINKGLAIDTEAISWTGTESLDPANGLLQEITLTGNVTTLTDNLADGEMVTLQIDDGTAYTITWPTITWVSDGGSAPTLQTTGDTWVQVWKSGSTLFGNALNGA